ncbi:MAG: hypothetical protein R2729_00330 [Bryobacteraceae bacterium]
MNRTLILVLLATTAIPSDARRFYDDDPLQREPAPRDASKAIRRKISDYYDFFQQTFAPPGEKQLPGKPIRAQAVNTLGEPMGGAWWEPRHYYKPMSIEELARGPGNENAPDMSGPWTVVKAKSEGVTPGFEFVDARKRRYVLKFDPLEYPEIATGPDVLVSKFFHALGYHVPQNYIVRFARDQLVLGKDVQLADAQGKVRPMTERDITELLLKVPRDSERRYRGGASLFLSGRPLGPYKYFGTRRDDPNDIVPHENRLELRGLSVFCAWLAHDDSRSINSLDMLVDGENGTKHIRHYLIDFGSTLGSASYGPNSPRSGAEYVFEWAPAAKQFLTFGLWIPNWAKAKYPGIASVGRFESKRFDAAGWVAEYPNPAFTNRLPDDAFWGAKQVMAFTDEQIRAVVKTGQYSDPRAEEWIVNALIERRDKIGRAFYAGVLPIDRFEVRSGELAFDDLDARGRPASSPGYVLESSPARAAKYRARWAVFDNESERASTIEGAATFRIPENSAEYLACTITGAKPAQTVTVYLRREASGHRVVGVDRTW